MDRSELSKAQTAICEALGFDAKRLTGVEIHMGVDWLWFRVRGYTYGSNERPFVVHDGSDSGVATFSITNLPDTVFYGDGRKQVIRLMVDGLRGEEFPSIEAALKALPTMGDELRATKGVRPGEGIRYS